MNSGVKNTVVVTGASSGIGRACVSRLIESGWHVFATVRKSEDAERLQTEFGKNLTPVIMEITDRVSVTEAAERIASQVADKGLNGLVNVAGIGIMEPLEYAAAGAIEHIFNVNVFGQISVTQALLPLLRKARGRIINISSVGAHIAIPFGGLLNASKGAFGLLSDTLRLELRPFGVRVITVEPGAIKTPAVDKTLGDVNGVIGRLPGRGAAQYGEMLRKFAGRAYAREMDGSSPEVVADAVRHALTASRPRTRYVVGKHAKLLVTLPRVLPTWLLDAIVLRIAGMPTRTVAV